MKPQLIDTTSALSAFLEQLPPCRNRRPDLYIDLEGDDLCRHGTLSLVTIYVESQATTTLVDVTVLKSQAFTTPDSTGRTLKTILEAQDIAKVFFDIRNDSDALFAHYGVAVAGIQDVQLMELATRQGSKRLVNGLAKCVDQNPDIGYAEKNAWRIVKDRGQHLCKTGPDGYAIFDRRPLPEEVLGYSVQDVTFLPKLRDSYFAKLCDASWRKIEAETKARVVLSQSLGFNGKGRHMSLAPTGWEGWRPSAKEKGERSLLEGEEPAPKVVGDGAIVTTGAQEGDKGEPQTDKADVVDFGRTVREGMEQAMMKHGKRGRRSPSPDDDDLDRGGYSGGYGGGYDSPGREPDYQACGLDCGYCGQCDY